MVQELNIGFVQTASHSVGHLNIFLIEWGFVCFFIRHRLRMLCFFSVFQLHPPPTILRRRLYILAFLILTGSHEIFPMKSLQWKTFIHVQSVFSMQYVDGIVKKIIGRPGLVFDRHYK